MILWVAWAYRTILPLHVILFKVTHVTACSREHGLGSMMAFLTCLTAFLAVGWGLCIPLHGLSPCGLFSGAAWILCMVAGFQDSTNGSSMAS